MLSKGSNNLWFALPHAPNLYGPLKPEHQLDFVVDELRLKDGRCKAGLHGPGQARFREWQAGLSTVGGRTTVPEEHRKLPSVQADLQPLYVGGSWALTHFGPISLHLNQRSFNWRCWWHWLQLAACSVQRPALTWSYSPNGRAGMWMAGPRGQAQAPVLSLINNNKVLHNTLPPQLPQLGPPPDSSPPLFLLPLPTRALQTATQQGCLGGGRFFTISDSCS